jgi:peptidoglycan/LPS O-acetylase OafA/YrhL
MRGVALDGLRVIAFLAVFAHHVFRVPLIWAGNEDAPAPGTRLTWQTSSCSRSNA